jgi:hypothetical protein
VQGSVTSSDLRSMAAWRHWLTLRLSAWGSRRRGGCRTPGARGGRRCRGRRRSPWRGACRRRRRAAWGGELVAEVEVGEHLHRLEQHAPLPAPQPTNQPSRRREQSRTEVAGRRESERRALTLTWTSVAVGGAHRIVDDHARGVHPDDQLLVLVQPLHRRNRKGKRLSGGGSARSKYISSEGDEEDGFGGFFFPAVRQGRLTGALCSCRERGALRFCGVVSGRCCHVLSGPRCQPRPANRSACPSCRGSGKHGPASFRVPELPMLRLRSRSFLRKDRYKRRDESFTLPLLSRPGSSLC